MPKGFLNLVIGGGSTVGEWLIKDQRINYYTFTGSDAVGQHIKAAIGLRRCKLELGSNSATLVFDDADLDKAAELCMKEAFSNAGQVCISVQRVLVHEQVFDQFAAKCKAVAEKLKVGDPIDPSTFIGPMIEEREAKRIEEWVQEAISQGADVLVGGSRDGATYPATILTKVTQEMKVVCQEVFGSVVSLMPFKDFDEAIAIANNSDFGLQGGAFTSNVDTAFRVAREFECGGIMINDASSFRVDQMPYGGVKRSGIGREGLKYAIEDMTEVKLVMFNLPCDMT